MVVTFVTSADPMCVADLDDKRLNKQRLEAQWILNSLLSGENKNHPGYLMWAGYTEALKIYINCCIQEWLHRGYKCEMKGYEIKGEVIWPWWFSWYELHLSHKCSLLRKNQEYYSQKFALSPNEESWLSHGYIWPSKVSISIKERVLAGSTRFRPEEVCDPIGAGAPAQYRWTLEDVTKWQKDKFTNPRTGRKIKNTPKGIYQDLSKASDFYAQISSTNK